MSEPERIGSVVQRVLNDLVPPGTAVCQHCKGSGECHCPSCSASMDIPGTCRDDFDSGRQGEGQCRFCNGIGLTTLKGIPLNEELAEEG